jgi:Protein of unknown function (DUF917)
VLEEVSQIAVARAVASGAKRETVRIAEMEAIPLQVSMTYRIIVWMAIEEFIYFQYIANKARVIVKAAGDFDFSGKAPKLEDNSEGELEDLESDVVEKRPLEGGTGDKALVDIPSYRPKIVNCEWIVSELDIEWIACGCYHLGTGGGGTVYPHFIRLREMMRRGAIVRIIEPSSLSDDAVVASGGAMGSPTVSMEKLPAME